MKYFFSILSILTGIQCLIAQERSNSFLPKIDQWEFGVEYAFGYHGISTADDINSELHHAGLTDDHGFLVPFTNFFSPTIGDQFSLFAYWNTRNGIGFTHGENNFEVSGKDKIEPLFLVYGGPFINFDIRNHFSELNYLYRTKDKVFTFSIGPSWFQQKSTVYASGKERQESTKHKLGAHIGVKAVIGKPNRRFAPYVKMDYRYFSNSSFGPYESEYISTEEQVYKRNFRQIEARNAMLNIMFGLSFRLYRPIS